MDTLAKTLGRFPYRPAMAEKTLFLPTPFRRNVGKDLGNLILVPFHHQSYSIPRFRFYLLHHATPCCLSRLHSELERNRTLHHPRIPQIPVRKIHVETPQRTDDR